jgi:ABC-2 type transport system permease protein
VLFRSFFNFVLPLVLLLLVATVFAGEPDELDVLIPGIAGMAIVATTFTALAFNVTFLREQGILKRMRGTPLPPLAYFGGLIGSAAANAVVQVLLVVAIGNVAYGVDWPGDPLALAVFTLLGVVCFAALGIAFAALIPNFDSAAAYVNAVFIPAVFVSGVFYSAESLPPALEGLAEALPLKHVIDGLGGAIVDGAGVGDHLTAVAAVVAWSAAGVALALRSFRWE